MHELALWLIPGAPLLATIWIVLVGRLYGQQRNHRPLVLALLASWVAALYVAWEVVPRTFVRDGHDVTAARPVLTEVYRWASIGMFHVTIDLRVDAMTALMLIMITTVSLLVAVFSSSYMHGDKGYPRFFAAMGLFVFSMCMLVMSGNFVELFLFWEGVGLCSYLLIGFWYTRPSAAAAAKKAFVVNRIGDFGLLVAIYLIYITFHRLDFEGVLGSPDVIQAAVDAHPGRITAICLLLLLGAIGKSAQFPLHVWLPDAMEGPTPVSALIHAATMVTAGVYLLARTMPLFLHSPDALRVVAAVGAITALVAAVTALTQYDLKRVLAYSTVSQLGYMFMSLGAAGADEHLAAHAVTFAMFHMFTHAFFKAVLFLSAGSVMHAMGDVIDMRRFSGLRRSLPITHITFLCGALALAGFPLLSGFWSKDEILSVLYAASRTSPHGTFYLAILAVGLLTSLLTAFYTFRAYFLTFWGPERFPEEAGHHPHDAPPAMAVPLYILAAGALLVGIVAGPTHLYAGYIHATPYFPHAEAHGMNLGMMAVSSLLAIGGIGIAYAMYAGPQRAPYEVRENYGAAYLVSQRGLFFDQIYSGLIVRPLRALGRVLNGLDYWLLDKIVDAFGVIPGILGSLLRPLQNGLTQSYVVVMVLGLVVGLISVLRAWAG